MDRSKPRAMNGVVNGAYDEYELSSSATSACGSLESDAKFPSNFLRTALTRETGASRGTFPDGRQASSCVEEQLLIVEKETRDEQSRTYKRKKTLLLSALKCILSILMSLTLFVCVVAGKISLVHIGQRLNYTGIYRNVSTLVTDDTKFNRETSFIMLVIILVFPSSYTLIRAICTSGMRSSHPWPTKRAIVWVSTSNSF